MEEPSSSDSAKEDKGLFERILAEVRSVKKTLEDAQFVVNSTTEFEGLTLVGGIKAILKAYQEEKNKNSDLKKEIEKLKNKT